MNKRFLIIYFIVFAGGVAGAFFYGQSLSNTKDLRGDIKNIRATGYKYINPLLDCDQDQADFTELKPFKKDLEQLVQTQETNGNADFISVYYRDMNNGPWVGINQEENFTPASLLKVPLMIAYYKLSEKNPEILREEITVTSLAQLAENQQTIIPKKHLEIGQTYTVAELLDRMIGYSDNDAAQLLISHVDLLTLVGVYKDFGVNLPTNAQPETEVSVRQYAGFFRLLFNGSYLSQDNSEKAIETLLNVDFKDGLVAGVPGNVPVAHKFGERIAENRQTQLHDCGIVYYPKRPYLLCVMTRGTDEQKMATAIKDISNLVYRQVDEQLSRNQ